MNPKEIDQEVLKRLPHPCCVPKEANLDKIIDFFRNEVIEEEALRRVTVFLPKESMIVEELIFNKLIEIIKQEIIEENKNVGGHGRYKSQV